MPEPAVVVEWRCRECNSLIEHGHLPTCGFAYQECAGCGGKGGRIVAECCGQMTAAGDCCGEPEPAWGACEDCGGSGFADRT